MSLSTRNYSKESRSSSYYSRSSSYHRSASTNNNYNSSYRYQAFNDDRPLSTRLIERDSSCPSLSWDWKFDDPFYFDRFRWRLDDPFYFDRLRWRFDKDFFKLGRVIPINHEWHTTSIKTIPVQYSSSSNRPHRQLYKRSNSDNQLPRHNENSMRRENRLELEDWPPRQEPPTRKRSSMTIFIRQPYVDQCEVPYYRQTLPTPTYPQSTRFEYY